MSFFSGLIVCILLRCNVEFLLIGEVGILLRCNVEFLLVNAPPKVGHLRANVDEGVVRSREQG